MTEDKKLTGYPSIDKPWLKYYSEEAINASLPECTIYEYLWENNKNYPHDIALVYFSSKVSYHQLFKNIEKTAKSFTALGVKPHDIVTVALPSIPEALYCVYALNRIGAVANMIHPLAGEKEIIHYLNEVKSEVAVIFDGTYKIIEKSMGQTSVKHAVVVSAGCSMPFGMKQLYGLKNGKENFAEKSVYMYWEQFIKNGRNTKAAFMYKDSREMAIISHTGGTTGDPKGVMCSDRNANALMHEIVCNFQYNRQGVSLVVLPPFVNYSLIEAMMAMLAIGYKVVLIPDYQPLKFANYIRKYRPNIILSIPAYWEAILKIDNILSTDMSCFEQIYAGGEAMSKESEQAVNQILLSCGSKTSLLKGLGSTEMTGGATQTYTNCNIPGSVGIPLVKMECKVVSPQDNTELGYCQDGEICFAGETVMLGYYNNESATNEIIQQHSDGKRWLHTGDMGYIDKDGVIFVTGRIKRIYMTKGQDQQVTKLFPDRIEKAICSHPAVKLCCVVGIPDEKRIHIPIAFVVLKHEYQQSEQIKEEIIRTCRDLLPEYMVPERIKFCKSLPRTERGKVDYRALEERAIGSK